MRVRDEIPAHGEFRRDLSVHLQESFQFRQESDPGQSQKSIDIPERLGR
jgi:hypothetical protein